MDLSAMSIEGRMSLHKAVVVALNDDDNLPSGTAKTFGVREYPDWRRWAVALEAELENRGVLFTPVPWGSFATEEPQRAGGGHLGGGAWVRRQRDAAAVTGPTGAAGGAGSTAAAAVVAWHPGNADVKEQTPSPRPQRLEAKTLEAAISTALHRIHLVAQIFTSWNQMADWLRRLDRIGLAARSTAPTTRGCTLPRSRARDWPAIRWLCRAGPPDDPGRSLSLHRLHSSSALVA